MGRPAILEQHDCDRRQDACGGGAHGANAGFQVPADLPGYTDSVRRNARGGYWFTLNQEKARLDATAPPTKHLVGV